LWDLVIEDLLDDWDIERQPLRHGPCSEPLAVSQQSEALKKRTAEKSLNIPINLNNSPNPSITQSFPNFKLPNPQM
jgi:hypothetical protein